MFKTPFRDKVTSSRVLAKCLVMFIRKYIKFAPRDFQADKVFVCESEYLGRLLHFKKLKVPMIVGRLYAGRQFKSWTK